MRIVHHHKTQRQPRLAMCLDLRYIDQGITFAVVTGLYSAASRSAHQPAGCAGWIELLRYSLMLLGDFARQRLPCSHRSPMAIPLIPPCRNHSVTESALSGCLSASRPHTHGSFRRCRIRSRYARFDARSSIKPSVLATLGGIDAANPMAHSSTTFILARRLRLQGQAPYRRQTLLRSVAVGAACGMAIDPKVKPSAIR